MEIIKSKENSIVKLAASLVKEKKERYKNNLFVAEGIRFCEESQNSSVVIKTVLATQEFAEKFPEKIDILSAKCSDLRFISKEIALKISDTISPQGIFCICEMPNFSDIDTNSKKYIALENLSDPGNIGTVLRTAEAFNIDGVILIGDCADIYNPKVLRSTMGAVFRMPVIRFDNINYAAKSAKQNGFEIYGAILNKNAKSILETKFSEKSICIIGNEANGLTDDAKKLSDKFVYIDMPGKAESLNAAVAASIIMWEMTKQG